MRFKPPTYHPQLSLNFQQTDEQSRLAQECAKLDPTFEKALAEEGLSENLSEN